VEEVSGAYGKSAFPNGNSGMRRGRRKSKIKIRNKSKKRRHYC
jgi:hypothetical protein